MFLLHHNGELKMRFLKTSFRLYLFWGIVFLLILVFGFKVSIFSIVSIVLSRQMFLALFCIYILFSVILYPLLTIMNNKSSILHISDIICIEMNRILKMPYDGFLLHKIFTIDDDVKEDKSDYIRVIIIYIWRFFETIGWWLIVIFGYFCIFCQKDNAIRQAINATDTRQKLIVLGVVLLIYIILRIIAFIIQKLVYNRWVAESAEVKEFLYSERNRRRRRRD